MHVIPCSRPLRCLHVSFAPVEWRVCRYTNASFQTRSSICHGGSEEESQESHIELSMVDLKQILWSTSWSWTGWDIKPWPDDGRLFMPFEHQLCGLRRPNSTLFSFIYYLWWPECYFVVSKDANILCSGVGVGFSRPLAVFWLKILGRSGYVFVPMQRLTLSTLICATLGMINMEVNTSLVQKSEADGLGWLNLTSARADPPRTALKQLTLSNV